MTVVNYTSAEMIRSIGNLLRQESFDLVHVDIIHLAACEAGIRKDLGSTPVFYNWHNIESVDTALWRTSPLLCAEALCGLNRSESPIYRRSDLADSFRSRGL